CRRELLRMVAPSTHLPSPAYKPQDVPPQPGWPPPLGRKYFAPEPPRAPVGRHAPDLTGMPGHVHKTLPPRVACAGARKDLRFPSHADYGPCPCRNDRKAPARVPAIATRPPSGREQGPNAEPTGQGAHLSCPAPGIRDKSRAIAPAPRSCHTGWKWCPALRVGETGEISSGPLGGCRQPRYVNALHGARLERD